MSDSRRPDKRRPSPLSIRLNDEERRALVAQAGAMALSTYVKRAALGARPSRTQRINLDREPVARVLAILGQSGIGPNLSQLASYAASGSLELDERTRTQILDACEDFRAVRDLLMQALGKPEIPIERSIGAVFQEAAQ